MEEKFIRNISIVCSIVGLAILFFISRNLQLDKTDIADISYDSVGKVVRICGDVSSKYSTKAGHQFIKLSDNTGTITIVVFNTTAKKFNLNSDNFCIVGTIDEYENKLEIIAKDVRVT